MSTAWWRETVWKNTYTHISTYRHVHVPIKNPQNINQTKPEKSQPILPPRIIKSKPWISKTLRAFSPWIIYDYSWTILKSQVHFYVFYVTRWFPFINFWSCYRLQMPGMSPFLTASIMEIMLQAGMSVPLHSQLSHPYSLLLSFSYLHAFQVWGRATMEDCSMLLTMEKKLNPHIYFERNTMFSHL